MTAVEERPGDTRPRSFVPPIGDRLAIATVPASLWHRYGHEMSSDYVRRYWLPTIGPTCYLALLAFNERLFTDHVHEVDVVEFFAEIGIISRMPIERTLKRVCEYGGGWFIGDVLCVRRFMPPLHAGNIRNLPAALRERHQAEEEDRRRAYERHAKEAS